VTKLPAILICLAVETHDYLILGVLDPMPFSELWLNIFIRKLIKFIKFPV
jgi:hypothetical protein